jgi:hypothetical protein
MNIERMHRVRDAVVANPSFTMIKAGHSCGSAACIMGSAQALMGLPLRGDVSQMNDPTCNGQVREWLDLTTGEHEYIFLGWFTFLPIEMITRQMAVDYLDNIIERGSVF